MTPLCRAILFACLALVACSPRDSGPPSNPAIWEVSRGGVPVGWLFGTIHALPDERSWRSPSVTRAIARADLLVVEAADLDRTSLRAAMDALATPVSGPPLAARLPPRLRPRLAELEDAARLRARSLDKQETWAAALALAAQAGGPKAAGVDQALLADFRGRPVQALEGARRQLAIFDALSEQDQRDLLAAVVEGAANAPQLERRVAEAWRTGKLAELTPLLDTGILADPELRNALLVDRNIAWMEKVAKLLGTKRRPLVAVGAAHMLGPDGLPALLAERGFTVRRLP